MDDIVKAAMAKWPNVPNCYGWLGLDARGNWYMRDDNAQAAGAFCAASAEPGRQAASKGSLLKHDKLIDFIQRNYAADAQGQWFFQNGPQRVFVELEATPFVWRVDVAPDFNVTAHTGQVAITQRCIIDEHGRVYLETALGFGRRDQPSMQKRPGHLSVEELVEPSHQAPDFRPLFRRAEQEVMIRYGFLEELADGPAIGQHDPAVRVMHRRCAASAV